MQAILNKRGTDAWGSGEFGARRGDHKHRGIDYACEVGMKVCSPVYGRVSKLGYPYADDYSYRYVEITDQYQARHRIFYINPLVNRGDMVEKGDVIGECQDIASRYTTPDKPMINHIHREILVDGHPVNPEEYA